MFYNSHIMNFVWKTDEDEGEARNNILLIIVL